MNMITVYSVRCLLLVSILFIITLLMTIQSYATPSDNGSDYGKYHFDYKSVSGTLSNSGMSGSNLVIYISHARTSRLDKDNGSYLEIGLVSTDSGNPHWYPVASYSPSKGFINSTYSWCVYPNTGSVRGDSSGNLYISTSMLQSMKNNGDKTFHYYMYTCNRDAGYYVGLNVTSSSITFNPVQYCHTHNKNKKTYTSINDSQHTTYYYCDADNQNMGTANENHTYGGWSGWTDLNNGQWRRQRTCSLCSHVQYDYRYIAYTIAFNGNGATSGSTGSISATYNTAQNLPANVFAKTGYHFTGWNTAVNGSGTAYGNTASVKNLTTKDGSTVILYAQWAKNGYTVWFHSNNGTDSIVSEAMVYDEAKPLTGNTFRKTAYDFVSWNTKADGTGTKYTDGQTVKNLTSALNGTFDLYARWTPHVYKIVYSTFEGTNSAKNPVTYTITTDTFRLEAPAAPDGFTFTGWTGSNGTTPEKSPLIAKGTYGSLHFKANYEPKTTDIHSVSSEKENSFTYQKS